MFVRGDPVLQSWIEPKVCEYTKGGTLWCLKISHVNSHKKISIWHSNAVKHPVEILTCKWPGPFVDMVGRQGLGIVMFLWLILAFFWVSDRRKAVCCGVKYLSAVFHRRSFPSAGLPTLLLFIRVDFSMPFNASSIAILQPDISAVSKFTWLLISTDSISSTSLSRFSIFLLANAIGRYTELLLLFLSLIFSMHVSYAGLPFGPEQDLFRMLHFTLKTTNILIYSYTIWTSIQFTLIYFNLFDFSCSFPVSQLHCFQVSLAFCHAFRLSHWFRGANSPLWFMMESLQPSDLAFLVTQHSECSSGSQFLLSQLAEKCKILRQDRNCELKNVRNYVINASWISAHAIFHGVFLVALYSCGHMKLLSLLRPNLCSRIWRLKFANLLFLRWTTSWTTICCPGE